MESLRNFSEQVLELVRDIATGMEPSAISELFGRVIVFPKTLSLPLLDDTPDLPAASIVFDKDAHIAEFFPAQEVDAFIGQFAGPVHDVLGFGETDDVVSVLHGHVVFGG